MLVANMPGSSSGSSGNTDGTQALMQAILAKLDRLETLEGQIRDMDQQQRAHNIAINRLERDQREIVPVGRNNDSLQRARDGPMGHTCFHKLDFPKFDGHGDSLPYLNRCEH